MCVRLVLTLFLINDKSENFQKTNSKVYIYITITVHCPVTVKNYTLNTINPTTLSVLLDPLVRNFLIGKLTSYAFFFVVIE